MLHPPCWLPRKFSLCDFAAMACPVSYVRSVAFGGVASDDSAWRRVDSVSVAPPRRHRRMAPHFLYLPPRRRRCAASTASRRTTPQPRQRNLAALKTLADWSSEILLRGPKRRAARTTDPQNSTGSASHRILASSQVSRATLPQQPQTSPDKAPHHNEQEWPTSAPTA